MALHLSRGDERADEVAALASHLESLGGGRVGVAGVLSDLGQKARRTLAPGLAVRRAFVWDKHDRSDPTWFPQGVAHSWHTGYADNVLVVSWYSNKGEGSRVTFLDLRTGRYRHVLLVDATSRGRMRPVMVHAGGLVWHGRWLHVAATRQGFLTFRVDDLMHDPTEELGYAYVLPLRTIHQATAGEHDEMLRYSFLSLDRTDRVPALVVGEYGRLGKSTRIARFALDEQTGLLVLGPDGQAQAIEVGEGVPQMQGAVVVDGVYYATVSHGRRTPGEVVVGHPGGGWKSLRWSTPPGPEDLTYHPPTGRFWSVTEHPGRRWVYAMKRRWFR
ncbi:hypothetical protein [Nocardioides sp. Kera G14]|uniref:hypothetical protein n=1 Tax=Nocardioides sp. Kera G14 TaxID=2884264 RepID=UPI001D120C5E|nr:hypothetical protein [Nocardioides sp. Kera G14]UDY22848.1 hypothetical protein LH076_12315 [Nocardioides sp. Kera G14]